MIQIYIETSLEARKKHFILFNSSCSLNETNFFTTGKKS